MPLLSIMAGPDGEDPLVKPATLGNPAAVSLEGLRVVTVEERDVRSR